MRKLASGERESEWSKKEARALALEKSSMGSSLCVSVVGFMLCLGSKVHM